MILLLSALALADDSGDFDHAHTLLDSFLEGAVETSGVDYDALAQRRATLDAYLAQVAAADTTGWSRSQQLALWINAYNAYTLKLILDHQPLGSIRDLDGGNPWDARTFVVAGEEVTLNQMEHGHARKLADGRVHAVVNCASKGCPPLPPDPLRASTVDAQLDEGARRWASTNAFVRDGGAIRLSKIFDWYGEDFEDDGSTDVPGVNGKKEDALVFLAGFVDEETASALLAGGEVSWLDYDWSLNAR